MKRLIFQVTISLILIGLVLWRLDLQSLYSVLSVLTWWHFSLFVLLLLLSQIISSLRWCLMARAGGISVQWKKGISSFFLGMYVNLFGLGTVGGDVVRGTIIGQSEGKKTEGVTCAFADRILGMMILLSIGLVATAIIPSEKVDHALFRLLSLFLLGGIVGWFVAPQILLKLIPENFKFRKKLEQVVDVFLFAPKKLAIVAGITYFYHFFQIALVWFLATRLQPNLSYWQMLTVVPFINVLSVLPISWNGIGVREKSYVFFFTPVMLGMEQAVALSLVWFSGITIVGIFSGAIGYVLGDFAIYKNLRH